MKNNYVWRCEAFFNRVKSGLGDFIPLSTTTDMGFRETSILRSPLSALCRQRWLWKMFHLGENDIQVIKKRKET